MKMNIKIILYLDGQLTGEERTAFEKELSESKYLKEQLIRVKNFNTGVSELKNITVGDDYFVQMIPKFRNNKAQKRKLRFFSGITYSVSTATAVLIVMLFVTNKNIKNDIQPVQNNMVSERIVNNETNQDAGSLSDQFGFLNMNQEEIASSDNLLNSMLIRELDLTPQSLNDISQIDNNSGDIQTILQGVNDKEADAIYNQILHKKIL
ncbi:MAG: hypothetical protein WCA84_16755 [Ignavibacteriaceae bacterium]